MDIDARPKITVPLFNPDTNEKKFNAPSQSHLEGVKDKPHQPLRTHRTGLFEHSESPFTLLLSVATRVNKIGQSTQKEAFRPSQDLDRTAAHRISSSSEERRLSRLRNTIYSTFSLRGGVDGNLAAKHSRLQRNPKDIVPEYWEHVESNLMAYARISERCFVLQDWNDRNRELEVLVLNVSSF